jgi:hypothetical protein
MGLGFSWLPEALPASCNTGIANRKINFNGGGQECPFHTKLFGAAAEHLILSD